MNNDTYIEWLANKLGISFNANKKQIDKAIKSLIKLLPYYAISKYYDVSRNIIIEKILPVHLAKTSQVGIYKVQLETNIKRLLEVLINSFDNNSFDNSIILKINDYVRINDNIYFSTLEEKTLSVSFKEEALYTIESKFKTSYLKFLESLQIKDYTIIPIMERFCYTSSYYEEMCFLFTIGHINGNLILAYENTLVSRSTFIFAVNEKLYLQAVEKIENYFTSNKIHKRSDFELLKKFFSTHIENMKVFKIIHDEYNNWRQLIKYYSLGKNTAS